MSQLMGNDGGLDVDVGVHADYGRTGFLTQLASVRYALHTGNQEDSVLGGPGDNNLWVSKIP